MPLLIDPEFKALIPPLPPAERETLEANIRASGGPIDPIQVWQGTIVDGHNRYEICQKYGLPFKTVEREFADRAAVKAWMLANQLGRRNLANDQALMICAEAEVSPPDALRSNAGVALAQLVKGTPYAARVIAGIKGYSLRQAVNALRRERGEAPRRATPTARAAGEAAERAASSGVGHTIVIPDLHAPYHDERAWGVCLATIEMIKPETVVMTGDAWDFYTVSNFDKDPARGQRLVDELGTVRPQMKRLHRAIGNAALYICQGNHEYRLDKYLAKHAGALHGLPGLSARELMTQDLPGATWSKYRKPIKLGRVLYVHDLRFAGPYAMQRTLIKAGTNVVFGHTHRGGMYVDGDNQGDRRFALNVGWLGNLEEIDYTDPIDTQGWTHGLGHLYTDPETGLVWPSFVPILRDRCHVAGRTIRL